MYEDDNGIMHPAQDVWRDVNAALQHGTLLPYHISDTDTFAEGVPMLAGLPEEVDEALIFKRPFQNKRPKISAQRERALDLRGMRNSS